MATLQNICKYKHFFLIIFYLKLSSIWQLRNSFTFKPLDFYTEQFMNILKSVQIL